MYVLELMDHYSAGLNVLIIAVIECVVINWIYGMSSAANENISHSPNADLTLVHRRAPWAVYRVPSGHSKLLN